MTTRVSFARRAFANRSIRTLAIFLVALLPLTLGAQGGRTGALSTAAQPKGPLTPDDLVLQHEGYTAPTKELADAVLIPRYLNVSLSNPSPDKAWFLDEIGDGQVTMNVFSKPFDELGGVFIDFKANRDRTLTIRNNVGIQMISATDGAKKLIPLAPGTRVSGAKWSPDGKSIAYFVHGDDATHIWMYDIATGKTRQLTKTPVLATFVQSFEFVGGGSQIAVVMPPDGRTPRPVAPAVPPGPRIELALSGEKDVVRTFPSLMTTQYEFALLEWHATGQLSLIDVATGAVKKFGQPSMIRAVDVSPDGQYARVTRMTKPFSYIVPVGSFGQTEELWDGTGKALAEISARPINLGARADDTPPPDPTQAPAAGGGGRGGANQNGKRELAWRTDGPGIIYLEQEPAPAGAAGAGGGRGAGGRAGGGRAGGTGGGAQAAGAPGGGAATQAPARKDRLMQWLPPFDATNMKLVYENSTRMTGARFSPDMQILFFSETSGQSNVTTAVYLSDPAQKYVVARASSNANDTAPSPGTLVGVNGGGGGGRGGGGAAGGRGGGGGGSGPVLLSGDKSSVFLQGTVNDKNPQEVGPKTFIDKVAIKTGDTSRVYESDNKDVFERVSTILDIDAKRFVVSREGPTEVAQNYLVDGATRKQLTENKDYVPDLTHAPKVRFTVERADGFKFRVSVTLPMGYQPGTRLPAIFWFYPAEFDTQEAYDRPDRTFNKNTPPNFGTRSMEFFARLGYAVVVNDAPIVGPAGQQNNNYVNDLRNDLAATIDELDKRALVDRTRLAIGGHSYGAFSTVNAMVNTPFFKAGIAGDGAYNRTLTPNGFQNERRSLWEAPSVYLDMSPFLRANHLTGALLMYHNLHDQNVGTDPTNSIRLFHALNGLGKTVSLYMYPFEDHGPVAKETLLDMWARWAAWLDKYVKNPQKADTKPAAAPSRGGGS